MKDNEIITKLEFLFYDFSKVINHLDIKKKGFISKDKLEESKMLIQINKSLINISLEIIDLMKELKKLGFTDSSHGINENDEIVLSEPPYSEEKTKGIQFRIPILLALSKLNGSGKRQDVLNEVQKIMKDQLKIADYKALPSSKKSIRWETTASFERSKMVKDGLISADSHRGIWEITQSGKEYLRKYGYTVKDLNKLFL